MARLLRDCNRRERSGRDEQPGLVREEVVALIRERERVEEALYGKRSQEAPGVTRGKWRCVRQLPVSIVTAHYRKGDG